MTSRENRSIREHLEAIKTKRGYLNPDVVTEEAESTSHPLHRRFEWDNDIAGPAYRREQARHLIAEVEITYVRANGSTGRMRQFYAVKKEDNSYEYETPEEIKANPISKEIVLAQMEREWQELRDRYDQLSEFWDLVAEAKHLEK